MTIQDLGSLGELIAAVATVATLAYLAVQIRAGARVAAVESKLQATRLMSDFVDSLIGDAELNTLFRRGYESFEDLSDDDSFRFYQLCLKSFWFLSAQHFQYRRGTLDEGEWHESIAVIRWWLRGRGCREWWSKAGGREWYGPGFAAIVDSEISEIEAHEASAPTPTG